MGIIAYGIIGLFLSIIGYLSFKAIIPFQIDKGLTEKENIAVGIIIAGIIIGVSIIVAAASYEPAPIVVTLPSSSSGGCGTPGASCQHGTSNRKESSFIPLPPTSEIEGKGSVPGEADKNVSNRQGSRLK